MYHNELTECIHHANTVSHISHEVEVAEFENVHAEQGFSTGDEDGGGFTGLDDLSTVLPSKVPPKALPSSLLLLFGGATSSESEDSSWISCCSRNSRSSLARMPSDSTVAALSSSSRPP